MALRDLLPIIRRCCAIGLAAMIGAAPVHAQTASGFAPATGSLQPFGGYLARPEGSTVIYLDDGVVFSYGFGSAVSEWKTQQAQSRVLRRRIEEIGNRSGASTGPKWFDPKLHGWHRLPAAPECSAPARYLHTATATSDGKVLIAGGLCDQPKMADDHVLHKPYAALSLWDAASHQWLAAPSLSQPRIYHSATLVPDGGVMIIGGESDPALSDPGSEPVLASVERFVGGQVTRMPPLAAARAKHSATAMPNNGMLVVGGFDAGGRAIASAELFDPSLRVWHTLPSLHIARHSHTATLLDDGRVLVAGGIGRDDKALDSTEIWDPARQAWTIGAALPIPLYGHAAARLASGQVLVAGGAWISGYGKAVPWAWTWKPKDDAWLLASLATPANETEMSSPVTLAPRQDGSALIFTSAAILRWEPSSGLAPAAPAWQLRPSAARLAGNRLMLIGRLAGDVGNGRPAARIWNAADDSWTEAGGPSPNAWLKARALQLPSGRVIYVGEDADGELRCEAWDAAGDGWKSCGSAHLEYPHEWRYRLGLLPDGRAFVIADKHEVLVLDEARGSWKRWQVEWHSDTLIYGAPIRPQKALTRIREDASGPWFDVNDAGARFWETMDPVEAPRMLWDGSKGLWTYILLHHKYGRDPQLLPGGCALSTVPLALFNPLDASITAVPDPGFGVRPGEAEMTVMEDGTVVVAGPSEGAQDSGSGFFHRKASCTGFAPAQGGDGYIAADLAVEPAAPVATVVAAPVPQPGWRKRALDSFQEHKWIWLAVACPLVAYALLRRIRFRRVKGAPSWMLRFAVYGVLLLVAFPVIRSLILMPGTPAQPGSAAVPCRMVGVWSSRHGGVMRRVELKDDGTFVQAASQVGTDPAGGYKGRWEVKGKTMTWYMDNGFSEPDVNPMQPTSPTAFTLTEGNGSKTDFELIRAVASTRCTRD